MFFYIISTCFFIKLKAFFNIFNYYIMFNILFQQVSNPYFQCAKDILQKLFAFFQKKLTIASIYDKILWYCGATDYTVRLGQSEPCKNFRLNYTSGYGGIGRRAWFRLRYYSEKISVSRLCETDFYI